MFDVYKRACFSQKMSTNRLKKRVCHHELEAKIQFLEWKHTNSPIKISTSGRHHKEVILTVFWNIKYPINIGLIEKKNETVNSASYCHLLRQNSIPPHNQDVTQGQFLKRSLTGFNSVFSFFNISYHNKVKEHSLPCYLPIAGGRIIGFISFQRVLALSETQTASSRNWTRGAVSISYDSNYFTAGA